MKKLLLVAIPCAAALVVFLIYLNLARSGGSQLSLWYVEEELPPSVMESLAEEYNSQRGRDSYELLLRSFSSEEDLAAAFEQGRPDLLLCSYTRAASLGSRGLLGAVELADRDYLPALEEALPFAGRSFFPIGSQAPLLVYNTALLEQAGISPEFGSFEAFLDLAGEYRSKTGKPFFSAESLSPLLCTCCASLGYRLEGEPEQDGMSSDFASVYNSLASAAMEGSFLPPGEDRLDLAAAGLLPCLVLDSPPADGLPEALSCTAFPLPEGGNEVYVPQVLGFAVTGANSYTLPSVRGFLLWLQDGFSAEDGLALGLVPVVQRLNIQPSDPLGKLLMEAYNSRKALIYPPLGRFVQNRQEMEEELCGALDLLY